MTRFPDWETPEAVAGRLPRLLDDAEAAVAALEVSSPTDFESLVWGLDDAVRELTQTWGRVSHMLQVMNSSEWRKVEETFQMKMVLFSLRCGQSPKLYTAAKTALALESDPLRRRILGKMIESAEHAGVGLEGAAKERFNAIQSRLAQLASDFSNAVIDATTEEISDAVYPEKMKHCPDAKERERLYRLRIARAPGNAARIDEILKLRAELASLLGYSDYAALSLSSKCAPSVDAVMKMIDDLDRATDKIAREEDDELGDDPAPWDRAYLAERLRERRYSYSEEELKRYFEFGDVLKGLFAMTRFLFGVEIVEADEKPPVWHPDVRYFKVLEKGCEIAGFYLDPIVRPGQKSGGAWMNEFVNRDDRRHALPLAVIVTNFPKPDGEGRCLLPLREVETLFHEFGHALQCMLTRVPEEDAAGINLVEWDAVEVASQFMENWCLDDRTGIALPAELKEKVKKAKNFRAASACRRQLAFAKLDLLLHRGAVADANALKEEMFAHFGLKLLPEDRFLNAFTHIFAGGYAAGYYGYKWAEVMSADVYGAFEEAGLEDDAAVKRIGERYRATILAEGGSRSALEVFRAFRGRDPEIDALLRQQGLRA